MKWYRDVGGWLLLQSDVRDVAEDMRAKFETFGAHLFHLREAVKATNNLEWRAVSLGAEAMREMERWVRRVVTEVRHLFADRGGPIVLCTRLWFDPVIFC